MREILEKALRVARTVGTVWTCALGGERGNLEPRPVRYVLGAGAGLGVAGGAEHGVPGMLLGLLLGTAAMTAALAISTSVRPRQVETLGRAAQAVRLKLLGAQLVRLQEGHDPGQYLVEWRYREAEVHVLDGDGREVRTQMRPPETYQVVVYLRAGDLLDAQVVQQTGEVGDVDVYGYLQRTDALEVELAGLGVAFPHWSRQVVSEVPAGPEA